ncbi:MAG TPA: hypothetical protein VHX60_15590 [Acidobacteriaceae bacterium]|jgi:hypothetical protein|nr:hypothetical protein [Acidobacteriaceae bacterium]
MLDEGIVEKPTPPAVTQPQSDLHDPIKDDAPAPSLSPKKELDRDDFCTVEGDRLALWAIRYHWPYALYALLPIVLGWPMAYGIIVLVRWVRRGFKVPTSPN